jgi:hypothetical protein
MITWRVGHWLPAVLVLGGLAAGCSGPGESPEDGEQPFASYQRAREPSEGPGALLEGMLVLRDGCLHVIADQTNEPWVPVLPSAAQWDDAEQALSLDGTSVKVGERIGLGGGERKPIGAPHEQSDFTVPAACGSLWGSLLDRGEGLWATTAIGPAQQSG